MLSFASKQTLRDLLIEIGQEEKQLEVLRQILCEQYDFEPYAAFRRIDRTRKGYITSIDVLEFLLANDQRFNEIECTYYIRHYDRDGDGRLAYLDDRFLPSLLPLDNPELRATATQRKVYDVGYDELLPYEVEYALARLVAREIHFYRELEELKVDLCSEYDFTYFDAFATVDVYESGFVDYYNLKNFLKSTGKPANEDLLIAILRRMDKDDDGRVNFEEFTESIQPMDPTFVKSHKKPKRTKSPGPDSRRKTPKKIRDTTSPKLVKSSIRTTSPSKKLSKMISPEKDLAQSQVLKSTKKKSTTVTPKLSQSTIIRKDASPLRKKSVAPRDRDNLREPDAFADLIKIFREIIGLEREVEFAKQDLALRNDFNPFDTFRFFDRKGKSIITVGEIEDAFAELGIFPNKEDIYLFIKRFDKTGDGKLRFTEFLDAFAPIQPEYYKLLKARTPINGDLEYDPTAIWTQNTIRLMKNLILLHLETEAVVEALRQKLNKDPAFVHQDCFDKIDYDGDGFISLLELRIIMDREGVFVTEKDVVYLINRFDKDNDEKISLVEFVLELTPKSKKKY